MSDEDFRTRCGEISRTRASVTGFSLGRCARFAFASLPVIVLPWRCRPTTSVVVDHLPPQILTVSEPDTAAE